MDLSDCLSVKKCERIAKNQHFVNRRCATCQSTMTSMGSLEPQGSGGPDCLYGGIMRDKEVNRQTGKWQYQDYSERYEKAGEMTFRELADWYFDHYAQHRLKASTVYNYRYSVERFMLPELGEIPLKLFNNLMLTDWFAHLDVSPEYCRILFITMRSIFSEAVRAGLVERHPCDYVVLPQKKKSAEEKEPLLTEAQARELYRMCCEDYWLHYVVRFLLLTGVRSGEAFGLRWEDVDFRTHIIHVRHNLANVASRHWLDKPKTKNSVRRIPMSPTVETLLIKQKKAQLWYLKQRGPDRFPHPEMVFTTKTGKYMDHTYVERTFKAMIKDTDFPDITLHSLRHAYATFMLAQGVDLKVVSSLLGHSSISTTANLYTDVLDRSRAEAAEKLELELFGKAPDKWE